MWTCGLVKSPQITTEANEVLILILVLGFTYYFSPSTSLLWLVHPSAKLLVETLSRIAFREINNLICISFFAQKHECHFKTCIPFMTLWYRGEPTRIYPVSTRISWSLTSLEACVCDFVSPEVFIIGAWYIFL